MKADKSHASVARRVAVFGGTAVFWLAVWQGLSMLVDVPLLIPSPAAVAVALGQLATTADFWRITLYSLLRVLIGFLAGLLVGTLLGVLTAKVWLLRTLLAPLLRIVRAAPVASFIMLAFLWIRTAWLPSFIAFLMVVPLVCDNVAKGIQSTDPKLLEMAKVYGLSRTRTFFSIWVPSVMPFFLASCTAGLGFAWKSGIAAEVICRPPYAIGTMLQNAKMYLETPDLFAWTATIVVLSILLEQLLLRIVRRFGTKYNVQ